MAPLLNDAGKVYVGNTAADAVYVGSTKVWSNVIVRTNLITNPSFETNTTGWSVAGSGTTLARVTTAPAVGSACAKVTYGASGPTLRCTATGLVVGQAYTLSAYVRAETSTELRMLTNGVAFSVGTVGTTWRRVSRAFTANDDISVVGISQATDNPAFYADAFMLEQGGVLGDYFDGSTPDGSGWDYAWTGTAHASTSTATSV